MINQKAFLLIKHMKFIGEILLEILLSESFLTLSDEYWNKWMINSKSDILTDIIMKNFFSTPVHQSFLRNITFQKYKIESYVFRMYCKLYLK